MAQRRRLARGRLGPRAEIVEEDAPHPARLVAVGKKEVAVAPALEAWIEARLVTIADRLQRAVKQVASSAATT